MERDDPTPAIIQRAIRTYQEEHNTILEQPFIQSEVTKDFYIMMVNTQKVNRSWYTPFIQREREEIHYDFQSREKQ